MGIIVDLGKLKVKEILIEAYLYALEQTALQNFNFDTLDDYPRGIVINFITKKDKLDWLILEELKCELPWLFVERKRMVIGFETPDYENRHDKVIFFQSRLAQKLSEYGLNCYADVYYRD